MKTPDEITVISGSYDETIAVASIFAGILSPGDIICLNGDLGAGKTAFTTGLVKGLGFGDQVSSPTFTILHQYCSGCGQAIRSVNHFDAYRLSGAQEFTELGFEDITSAEDAVSVIEWADRLEGMFDDTAVKICLLRREAGSGSESPGSGRMIIFSFSGRDEAARSSVFIRQLTASGISCQVSPPIIKDP